RDKLVTGVQTCALPISSPGRMSSVASMPMFGVSSVFFHGIGLRHIGMPARIDCGLPPPGGNRITSYFALRFGSFAASWVLMYERSEERRVGKECRLRRW